jgi:hypothetical protein
MILFAPYPMTIKQMADWARQVGAYSPMECAKALHLLNGTVTLRLKRGDDE